MTILTPIAVSSAPLLRAIQAGGDLSGKALAEAAGRKPNNISRDLGALEKAGLIAPREPGSPPALTDDGVAVLAELDGGGPSTTPGFGEFDIDLIDQDPTLNPRVIFDDEELDGLAASIRDKGVTQPILIRQGVTEGRYRIVAGERRWRASRKAEKTTIPAMYRELTDAQAFEIATIENIQRTDLSPLEEARAFRRIIDTRMAEDPSLELKDAKLTIADAVRKTVRYVEQRMDLLELPPILQVRLELDKDDNAYLSLKEARNEVQKQRSRERAEKAAQLPDDELLAMGELLHAMTEHPGVYTHTTRVSLEADDIQGRLTAKNLIYITPPHDDPTYRHARLSSATPESIERQIKNATDEGTLAALRYKLQGDSQANGYSTPWLRRSLIEPDPLLVAQEEKRAEERREREAEQQRRDDERKKDAEAYAQNMGAPGKAFLAEVRAFEAEASQMDDVAFRAAYTELQARHQIAGPYALGLNRGQSDTVMLDGNGQPYAGAGPALEARRRLMAIALNFAAGHPIYTGEELATPWSQRDPEPDELSSRAEFLRSVAGCLEDDLEVSEAHAASMAEAGLVAFLLQEGVEYGDDEYDWHDDGAMALAELIRVEGLGMDDEPAQIDIEDAIEAQAEDEATPDYLRNLAGPGAEAEASQ